MGGAQCLAHAAVDRREAETDSCTAYMRHDSDTMEGVFTQCSQTMQHLELVGMGVYIQRTTYKCTWGPFVSTSTGCPTGIPTPVDGNFST